MRTAVKLQTIPIWPLDQVRHFLVHPTLGDDANAGYVDADVDAVGIVTTGRPVKTLEKVLSIIPQDGNGRAAILHIANDDFESGTHFTESLDLSGLSGYRYFLKRAWTAWLDQELYPCWSFRDRDIAGARIAMVGPNTDGSFTVATTGSTDSILTLTVATGGAAFATDAATLYRIRFSGNVTAGALNMRSGVYKSYVDTLELIRNIRDRDGNSLSPVAGDTFWIERPGVAVDGYKEGEIVALSSDTLLNPSYLNITCGIDWSSSVFENTLIGSLGGALYSFCSQSYANPEYEWPCLPRFNSNLQFNSTYFGPVGSATPTFGGTENSYGPTYFAGNINWTTLNYIRWDSFFGARLPPTGTVHGEFGVWGRVLEAESGCVFLGGISMGFNVLALNKNNVWEYTSRKKRFVRVCEVGQGFWRGELLRVILHSIYLDDAVLKFADASYTLPGTIVWMTDIIGGATVNAVASGKKVGIYCRGPSGWAFQFGNQVGNLVPTATGVDGDILLYNFEDWTKTLSYAEVKLSPFKDLAGNTWLVSNGNAGTGSPRVGALLTNADVVITPGTDKRSLYMLPNCLTANHQAAVSPADMLPFQTALIRIRDLSANTYAVVNGGPLAGTLFTKPASPGATIDVRVRLNAAGTDIEMVSAEYEDA